MKVPKPEHPHIEKLDDNPIAESRVTHPAYATIGASRVSASGGGYYLFGSDFKHNHFVTISISYADTMRSLSNDRNSGGERIIEVSLSEAQWASFVSSMNSSDTACTLSWVKGEGHIPQIASIQNRQAQFDGEVRERLSSVTADLKNLRKLIEDGAGKKALREAAQNLDGLENSVKFIAEQFGEHMEGVTEHAKIEISAFAEQTLRRAGLAALTGEAGPISFPGEKK